MTKLLLASLFLFIMSGCNFETERTKKTDATATNPTENQTGISEDKAKNTAEPLDDTMDNNSICSDLMPTILASAESLSGTPYSQPNKTDCSGMFHKVVDSVREFCPDANLPNINNARSSRSIAKWYYNNSKLIIIRDPASSQHLIKPGMVMFYGYGNRADKYDYKTINIDTLMTRGVGINHVAIVTSVNEENGVVQTYNIFHGRNPRYPAGITTSELDDSPTYGNGPEPWLAVAEMVAPSEE